MNTNENINAAPVVTDAKTEKTDTTPVVAEVKSKKVKAKKNKGALNKETTKVLTVIVKNAGLTATKIQKKLRWAFIPTRALGFLRHNKFVIVSKTDKGYTVSAAGTAALAGAPTLKRNRKPSVKKTPAPVVPMEPVIVPEAVGAI
jgi:hypothetical protein